MKNDKQADLGLIRHSLSHVMALAVSRIWKDIKFAIGPAIDNGFYYDFDFGEQKIGEEDLVKIEEEMRKIISSNLEFKRFELDINEALKKAEESGQVYKKELIEDLKKENEKIVSYYELAEFVDLCRGPHVETSGNLPVDGFKITKLAGAYWRGDEKNKMLTRIYGIAYATKKELDEYLQMIAEAEKRDHRKIGKEQDIFMMHDVAPGMPFFLPHGMIILKELIDFVREYSYGEGYKEVRTPQLLNSELWKISGHWGHYQEDMFCMHHAEDDIDIGVKPMNCPAHMLIFKNDIRSYRDLPLRIAETTTLYRNEKSGTLHGLTRVRSLSQDDTHIFCTHDQILSEISELLRKIKEIYTIFNLHIDEIHLSTRPEKFLGEKEMWDVAENNLKQALKDAGLEYQINEGDGAFYGPKIDVKIKDAIGRQWQLATIQLDYQLPQRFDLHYADADGTLKTPVVIHRALLGSMERFLGIIIEHYAGLFPIWLSPVQVKLVAVSEKHIDFVNKLSEEFKKDGVRTSVDVSDETVGNKIRKAVGEKVPYMLVIGDKEMSSEILMIRDRGSKDTREISKADFIKEIMDKINSKQ